MKIRTLTISLIAVFGLTWTMAAAQTVSDNRSVDSLRQTRMHNMAGPPFFAQNDDSDFGPGDVFPPGGHGPMRMEGRQLKHLEQFRMFELLKFLDLTVEQEVDFLTGYKKMRSDQDSLDQTKRDYLDQLRSGLKEDTLSEQNIDRLVKNILGIDRQKLESSQKFVEDMRGVLTPAQLGKYVVFEEDFEYELLKRLRGFHQRGGPMDSQ